MVAIASAGRNSPAFSRFIVVRYRINDTSAMNTPIAMKPTPIINDIPLSCPVVPCIRKNSRKVIPNFATTKPNTMMLMLVRIHARKVRSFARWSEALPSPGGGIEVVIGVDLRQRLTLMLMVANCRPG